MCFRYSSQTQQPRTLGFSTFGFHRPLRAHTSGAGLLSGVAPSPPPNSPPPAKAGFDHTVADQGLALPQQPLVVQPQRRHRPARAHGSAHEAQQPCCTCCCSMPSHGCPLIRHAPSWHADKLGQQQRVCMQEALHLLRAGMLDARFRRGSARRCRRPRPAGAAPSHMPAAAPPAPAGFRVFRVWGWNLWGPDDARSSQRRTTKMRLLLGSCEYTGSGAAAGWLQTFACM